MWRILLIQGANMVHLGKREPEIYGCTTASELTRCSNTTRTREGTSWKFSTPSSKARPSIAFTKP
jgi:3-dehydroquinate dehydratase